MEKNQKRNEVLLIVIALIPIIYFLFSWSSLPEPMPTHYDINMKPDGYSSRLGAFILVTVLSLVMFLLFKYIPKIDPKGKIKVHSKLYVTLRFIMTLLIAFICMLIVLSAQVNVAEQFFSGGVCIALGALFIGLGNYLPIIKQNFFVGIRTPWTLSSESVWTKTHRIGGKWMVIGGVIMVLLAFIPGSISIILAVGVLTLIMLALVVYSFLEFKKEKAAEN